MQIKVLPLAVQDVHRLFGLFGGVPGFQSLLPLLGWPIVSDLALFSTCTAEQVTQQWVSPTTSSGTAGRL